LRGQLGFESGHAFEPAIEHGMGWVGRSGQALDSTPDGEGGRPDRIDRKASPPI
jgi:hypothetical protein